MSVLGAVASPWIATTSRWQQHLRVIAYHEISDARAFASQMAFLIENFQPVTIEEALNPSLFSRHRRPVWITFDDGDPSIIEPGLTVLSQYGVSATAFICPGLVDTEDPFWWQTVQSAVELGLTGADTVRRLKSRPDSERREVVAGLRRKVEDALDAPLHRRQLTSAELHRWVGAGHNLGNHTWDHPMLDQCEDLEQVRQIETAHRWIEERFDAAHPVFAYPNGNTTGTSREALADLGYAMALLFDHQTADLKDPLAVSRIRVNADDTLDEFKARVSGVHPFLHHALRRS